MKKDLNAHVEHIDSKLISFSNRFSVGAAQVGLAVIFLWFGALKLLGKSPVDDLIINLSNTLAPNLEGASFVVGIGVLEILIALTIIDRQLLRLAILFLVVHLILVSLPLFVLPEVTWSGFLIPTLEGQYILKNIIIATSGMVVLADLQHLKEHFVPTR
jgi:uncharacterized membrane protein YkgB